MPFDSVIHLPRSGVILQNVVNFTRTRVGPKRPEREQYATPCFPNFLPNYSRCAVSITSTKWIDGLERANGS